MEFVQARRKSGGAISRKDSGRPELSRMGSGTPARREDRPGKSPPSNSLQPASCTAIAATTVGSRLGNSGEEKFAARSPASAAWSGCATNQYPDACVLCCSNTASQAELPGAGALLELPSKG